MLTLPDPYTIYDLPGDSVLYLLRANIAELDVDAVVSSDDTRLSMGGGVSAELRRRGGDKVWRGIRGRLTPLASVREAPGGDLKAGLVLHVAVVDWRNDILPNREIVRAASAECLRVARERAGGKEFSIAFPLLGSGTAGLTYVESLSGIVEAALEAASTSRYPFSLVISLAPGGPYPASLQERVHSLLKEAMVPPETLFEGTIPAAVTSPALPATGRSALAVSRPTAVDEARLLSLPSPIAIPLFSALNQPSPAAQFRTAIEAGEAFVRFLVSSAVAGDLPTARNDRIAHVLSTVKQRPSLGDWVSALRKNLRSLRELSQETADLLVTSNGRQTSAGHFLLEDLTEFRNKYVGHGPPLPDGAYTPLLPGILEPLQTLAYGFSDSWQFDLFAVADFDWGEGENVQYVTRSLRGPFAVFPTMMIVKPERLMKRHVFLLPRGASDRTQCLDLDPLITYVVCPLCQRDDIFFLDCQHNDQVKFRSFLNGHETFVPWDGVGPD